MKIEIYSFDAIEALAKSPFAPRTSLISIGDTGAAPPELKYRPEHILRLVFDDITLEEIKERCKLPENIKSSYEELTEFLNVRGINIFSDKQALRVADFVNRYAAETDLLICQCHFGKSRSAGCAAGITEHLYGNSKDIFADERYYPNKLVYNKVLRAFMESEDEKIRKMDV